MGIIEKAEQFVFNLLKDKLSPEYTYHNFNHTLRVVKAVNKLANALKVEGNEHEGLILAGYFHDTGYVNGHEEHELKSIEIFRQFAVEEHIASEISSLTQQLILATDIRKEPETLLEFIIRDADCSHFASKKYVAISDLLRREWELSCNNTFSDLEWLEGNLKMLSQKHRFYTEFAKEEWQPKKEQNIMLVQQKITELAKEQNKKENKKAKDEKPERGVETMFKVTLNNHTQLSQIADSKANILLSVNAIIISISLSTLIPKLDSPGNAHLVVPTFILLIFSVVCIIFAILSTRPKVTTGSFTRKEIEDKKVNLLFFGNFYKMPLDEYEWAMNEMMKDKEYLYNTMIKDLYFLGLVLNRKYNLLRITYNIFMVGIIISVIAFVIAFQSIRA
ncbi:MAG: phosphohydrolase [Flavobacterium sp. BFFFF1]|uniref:Pycsar system effector family protein n=1 Tax=unclassified Flavobacterium TaxID=196869 RepID=UPI000BDA33D2|nr:MULTISPECIES: Pycsar system effector family protein [unclassified Flavobacterium]OYU79973.1 MAG: phosphohydrolase [Flavobacterium sp. BFFFF1]